MALNLQRIESKVFELLSDPELPQVLRDIEIVNCRFVACHFGDTAKSPAKRRRLERLIVRNCVASRNSGLGSVHLHDVTIDGLRTSGVSTVAGAAFSEVVVRGRCGRFLVTALSPDIYGEPVASAFSDANEAIYQRVPWALDISDGIFDELDIRGIPVELIRRDPESQFVVRLKHVVDLQHVWRRLDLGATPWAGALDNMLHWKMPAKVLVAPKGRKEFDQWRDGLRKLQDIGVADP
jgi:hypothetical protein